MLCAFLIKKQDIILLIEDFGDVLPVFNDDLSIMLKRTSQTVIWNHCERRFLKQFYQ